MPEYYTCYRLIILVVNTFTWVDSLGFFAFGKEYKNGLTAYGADVCTMKVQPFVKSYTSENGLSILNLFNRFSTAS